MSGRSRAEILLVEDEDDDAELLTRALLEKRPGTCVTVVGDGIEALRRLLGEGEDSPLVPKLIVLDLHLPGLDGMEVLRCLASDARTRRIPVVVLSGTCSPRDVGASRFYGARACIRKPCTRAELQRVAEMLAGELQH